MIEDISVLVLVLVDHYLGNGVYYFSFLTLERNFHNFSFNGKSLRMA